MSNFAFPVKLFIKIYKMMLFGTTRTFTFNTMNVHMDLFFPTIKTE